jgi:hypothetical protein
MVHKLTWYSHDSKTANLIDYVIVNRRLADLIQDRSAVIDVNSNDHHLVVSRVNLKAKFAGRGYKKGFEGNWSFLARKE